MTKIRHSMIEVPGNVAKMLAKSRGFQADVLVLDVEDSVPPTAAGKIEARKLISDFLAENRPVAAREIAVRINASDSEWFLDDVRWLASVRVDTLMLPKIRSAREYIFIEELLNRVDVDPSMRTIVVVETPGAVVELNEIVRVSRRLDGLLAGGFDYTVDCQSTALNSMLGLGDELTQQHLTLLRQTVVAVARANGMNAIDGPLIAHVKDVDALRRAVKSSRINGFDGCIVFYPPMLDVVNEVFAPTEQELVWAQRIKECHFEAVKAGRAALQLDGMVILPHHVTVADRMLRSADRKGAVVTAAAP